MDADFLDTLDELRNAYKKPLILSSAYRCPEHNQIVSTTGANGPHTTGRAVDIKIDRDNAFNLLGLICERDFSGIGVAQKGNGRFLHVDNLREKRPALWSY